MFFIKLLFQGKYIKKRHIFKTCLLLLLHNFYSSFISRLDFTFGCLILVSHTYNRMFHLESFSHELKSELKFTRDVLNVTRI